MLSLNPLTKRSRKFLSLVGRAIASRTIAAQCCWILLFVLLELSILSLQLFLYLAEINQEFIQLLLIYEARSA